MQCNIDAKGKRVRLVIGLSVTGVAAVLLLLRLLGVFSGVAWWPVIAVVAGFGLFSVFQARAGWCAVRAMGFKTKM